MSFICDTPVPSFIKNVRGRNGYYGCDKSETEGVHIDRRMIFRTLKAQLPNNYKFLSKEHYRYIECPRSSEIT